MPPNKRCAWTRVAPYQGTGRFKTLKTVQNTHCCLLQAADGECPHPECCTALQGCPQGVPESLTLNSAVRMPMGSARIPSTAERCKDAHGECPYLECCRVLQRCPWGLPTSLTLQSAARMPTGITCIPRTAERCKDAHGECPWANQALLPLPWGCRVRHTPVPSLAGSSSPSLLSATCKCSFEDEKPPSDLRHTTPTAHKDLASPGPPEERKKLEEKGVPL